MEKEKAYRSSTAKAGEMNKKKRRKRAQAY